MRNAPFLFPALHINALSSFTHPFLSLSLAVYSVSIHLSIRPSLSIFIFAPYLSITSSLRVFILSLAIQSCSWLAHSDANNSLYLSREPQRALSWVMFTGEEEGDLTLFLKCVKLVELTLGSELRVLVGKGLGDGVRG